jgi:hypothetical protein
MRRKSTFRAMGLSSESHAGRGDDARRESRIGPREEGGRPTRTATATAATAWEPVA